MTSLGSTTTLPLAPIVATEKPAGTLSLGLLVALVVGSILGSGIFGLPQNMASSAGAGAILMGCGVLVIATGGGGIPVARSLDGPGLVGVEAVIDKDLCAGLLAQSLGVGCLVIATDVANVFLDWSQPTQRAIGRITPAELARHPSAEGSMGPKVQTASKFATATGKRTVIGSLDEIEAMLAGTAGTQVAP